MNFTDIWKRLHVIELHTVFVFNIIETTSRKIVTVTLTKAVNRWEYEDIQLPKPADEVLKGMNARELYRGCILLVSLTSNYVCQPRKTENKGSY